MSDDAMTMDIRKFLKQMGVSSHQEIEKAIEQAKQAGDLEGKNSIRATMKLEIPELGVVHTLESEISIS